MHWAEEIDIKNFLFSCGYLTNECVIDEQLQEMENDENWKECIQVNIEAEPPLNILKKNTRIRFLQSKI